MPIAPAIGAALIGGATSLAGGLTASSAAKKASRAQVQASQDANAAQRRMFEEQKALQEPFRQGGLTAQNEIMQLLGIGGDKAAAGYGSLGKSFGTEQFQQDPGYGFRQAEGMKALERSAAARGNLLSGSTLKGVQRFGQDLASQEYQNAFNRYQTERSAKLNPLQSLMGSGQSATNVMTGAAGQMGQNEASNLYNAGQARASGYVGSANALSNALGQIGGIASSYRMNNAIINYLTKGAPGGVIKGS
ncbi:hypothetical protein [Sphingorhabdus sp.]|uniref:hypothetical protein n=1 Tax=Sphingorhabdus sp. TaxID=1902408 RepID=UPI003340B478